ncbi:MAG: signal peptidase I [Actinobacteria bacterium RBG_19FT_COMBO_54_7]|uniref:Signal peptidase I n=1 Tax=Candidatus Solincola sediminis TaxID=1797199 RepID=A0A1F2WGF8_9ACTN|nr:MAG: signal peptidase I [Candidatus Solincola sediminis]OFW56211.1 MAG: signal peptidase I [Candidatus Solincola sediminis]OFW69836.1 MAG: signal peptidase I [Actinobacteria bacterium RBG_19FT_COMBO_54_7]
MRLLSRFLSLALYMTVIVIMVFAIFANFIIIAQGLFSPLNIVEGDSMSPTIKSMDAVVVSSADRGNLKEGDVVVFRDPEEPEQNIMHRIIGFEERDGSTFVATKGDANSIVDPFIIPLDRVWGRVSLTLPKAGFFLNYLKSAPGFITCVICPFAVLFLYLVVKCYIEKHSSENTRFTRELIPSA